MAEEIIQIEKCSTPEPWYSKQARQTPFVYYIKSFTISSQIKNEIIKYYYA